MIKNILIYALIITNTITGYFAYQFKTNPEIILKTKYIQTQNQAQPSTKETKHKTAAVPTKNTYFYKIHLANGGETKAESIKLVKDKVYMKDKGMTAVFKKSQIIKIEKINKKTMIPKIITFD